MGSALAGLPVLVGFLVALAIVAMWMGLAPSRRNVQAVDERLDQYLDRADIVEVIEMQRPFAQRAMGPIMRRVLGCGRRIVAAAQPCQDRGPADQGRAARRPVGARFHWACACCLAVGLPLAGLDAGAAQRG